MSVWEYSFLKSFARFWFCHYNLPFPVQVVLRDSVCWVLTITREAESFFKGLFSICVASCVNNVFRFFLTKNAVEIVLPLWTGAPFPRDSGCSFSSCILFIPHKSLGLKKVWLCQCRFPSETPSIRPICLEPYLLVAMHHTPLINFPEGGLILSSPAPNELHSWFVKYAQ